MRDKQEVLLNPMFDFFLHFLTTNIISHKYVKQKSGTWVITLKMTSMSTIDTNFLRWSMTLNLQDFMYVFILLQEHSQY